MVRRTSPTFTEVELEFMQVIWEKGQVSTEDIQTTLAEQNRHLSDGSIRKILSILMRKDHLARRRVGRSFFYRAKERENHSHRNIVKDLLRRAFRDSPSLMVAALLGIKDVNREDIEEIKKLIAEHERGEEQ